MSTFSENERIEFQSHSFIYVSPTSSDDRALFLVKDGDETVREFDITGQPLGLKATEGYVVFGLSAFPEGNEKIDMDFSTRPQSSGFEIILDADGAITGVGTIDIRDMSRVHHFLIGNEPINIWLDTKTGWLVVQMRDRDTQQTDEADWYVEELIS
jgi:hypothetical protein